MLASGARTDIVSTHMTSRARDGRLGSFLTASTRMLRELPWRSLTLWLIVAVNLVLIVLYIWSRRGGEINVRVEAIGDTYTVNVDGRTVAQGEFAGHPKGGVGFRLKPNDHIATIAGPVGIESLRVTNADDGEVLFEDGFGGGADDAWEITSGRWGVNRGVLTTETGGLITVGDDTWQNYVVEAKLRNIEDVGVFVWMEDTGSTLQVDMSFFRNYRTVVQKWLNNESVGSGGGRTIQLDEGESIRSITAMMLRPYPAVLLLVLSTGLIALGAGYLRNRDIDARLTSAGRSIAGSSGYVLAAMAVFAFVLLWYILYFVSDDMPHVPDSVLYVWQSKIFASFHLTAPAPPAYDVFSGSHESFSIFDPDMDQVVDGRWFSHYPFGHPMFLAFGQLVRVPSLVPPLLGAGCIGLIYLLGRRFYGASVGLIAGGLLLFSPFFQMTASNYMSHNTAAFVILSCLAFYTWKSKWPWLTMLAAGLCFGLLFNIRPLPAVALMIPLGGLMAYEIARAPRSGQGLRLVQYGAFACGALAMLGLWLLYNLGTTGHVLESGYAEQGTFSDDAFGFSGAHTVALGLQNQRQLLGLMQLVAFGWPAFIGFGFAMLPFVLGTRNRYDYFLVAAFLSFAALNIFYKNAAVMNGPRFWYESLPFLTLLTARGAMYLRDAAVQAAEWMRPRMSSGTPAPSTGVSGTWVLAILGALVVFSASGWMLQTRQAWTSVAFTPARIRELHNFNFSDDRLLTMAEDLDVHDALIFVRPCTGWWCYGSEFWTNNPGLDGDIVWVSQLATPTDLEILEHYPNRKLYLADYERRTLIPITSDDIVRFITGSPPSRPGDGQ